MRFGDVNPRNIPGRGDMPGRVPGDPQYAEDGPEDEWVGVRWAGDMQYGHCSACGKPATAGPLERDWWHCYATHIVACRDETQVFVHEGWF